MARPSLRTKDKQQNFEELLARHFSAFGSLSSGQLALLRGHYELLVRWNRVLNLTAIKRLEEAVVRHYCESLFLGVHLPAEGVSVLDVGSGAGFPGIPIAVLRPECEVVLAESHQRKAAFLREATRDWPNVRVEARRAEEIDRASDWVVSRAVRWDKVIALAQRRVSLLLGNEDAQAASAARGFNWEPVIPLPWGQRRVLLLGSRVPDVPRGTA
ncbi:MAG: 16S rRNA (guanine(527)-N(7))-methyltransferase RsmG [Rhodospirillales bacterium]